MTLIRKSGNMGTIPFSEFLKFKKIKIPEYIDITSHDIIDYTDLSTVGIVTVVIDHDECIIYDKCDIILNLLFSCLKAGYEIPVIDYCNMMSNQIAEDLYIKNYDYIMTSDAIDDIQVIYIEVNAENRVKFN